MQNSIYRTKQEKVDKTVSAILEVLGKPENDLHHKALADALN